MTLRRYHTDIGIPENITDPVIGTALAYSIHAHQAARQDRVSHLLPAALPASYMLIEVEALDSEPVKWVVRLKLDSVRDLILAITSTYIVKSVWVNLASDTHATLDRSKYDQPEEAQ